MSPQPAHGGQLLALPDTRVATSNVPCDGFPALSWGCLNTHDLGAEARESISQFGPEAQTLAGHRPGCSSRNRG